MTKPALPSPGPATDDTALPRLVFLLSLPRSGSTLLHRMLAAHPQVATTGETYWLLPWLYATRSRGAAAEYAHPTAARVNRDSWKQLPGGREACDALLRDFAIRLYALHRDTPAPIFLVKNPRLSVVADDLVRIFPDARFLILWRNPLAMAGSMFDLYGHWPMGIWTNAVDLYPGLTTLTAVTRRGHPQVMTLNYEQLIDAPQDTLARICKHVDLPEDPGMIDRFSTVQLQGAAGDPKGPRHYQQIERAPLEKWKTTICNPLRRRWMRNYLNWLGHDRLALMGYDLTDLQAQLRETSLSPRGLLHDLRAAITGRTVLAVKHRLFKQPIVRDAERSFDQEDADAR